jgi:hypothetical protein
LKTDYELSFNTVNIKQATKFFHTKKAKCLSHNLISLAQAVMLHIQTEVTHGLPLSIEANVKTVPEISP